MVLICLAMLSGCATTQMVKMEQKPELVADQATATLVIIRDTFFGGGVVFWNYLDGKLIGETSGNSYIVAREEALEAMTKCSYLELKPDIPREEMDPTLYQNAIDEYETGIKENPEGYKELLEYSGLR